MDVFAAPKANPETLLALIRSVYDGLVVVPRFQRPFVWKREDIEEVLASILQGYFIGTFLMLDTPAKRPMFPYTTVEGVKQIEGIVRPNQNATVRLVLDGQQRITSLFYALYGPDIPLKGSKYPHKFFLRLDYALTGDLDEAIVGISTQNRRSISEMRNLVETDQAIPFTELLNSGRFYQWLYSSQTSWKGDEQEQIKDLYERLQKFMVPVIALSPDTGKDNIVNIFERINRTGVSLSLFDLAVAQLYLKGVKLRELWEQFAKKHELITKIVKPEFLLRLIALIQEQEVRRRNLLNSLDDLTTETFNNLWDEAADAIVQAHQRITAVYGAFSPRWIPYTTLIVPLAALLLKLRKTSAGAEAYQKLDCWYWGSVLGQRYDSAVDTKTYQDYRDIVQWIENKRDSAPEWLQRLSVQSLNLDTDEPYSTLYRGLMGLIAKQGAWDFSTGQPAELNDCHDDHIFPKSIFGQNYSVDTLLNRTLISKETNKAKGNKLPTEFLEVFLEKHGKDHNKLKATLSIHFISQDAYQALKNNDFDKFIAERHKSLEAAVQGLLALTEPVDLEPPPDAENVYWLTPVRSDEEESAETVIQTLVGSEGIYAFGDKTPGRRYIKPDDWICFYATGKGVVAHARVISRPDRKQAHPKVRHSDKYPWVFMVGDAVLYLDQPVSVNESLRSQLDAFQGRDPTSPWAWFVQATRKLNAHDFDLLTR
jgi:hypothetical protein